MKLIKPALLVIVLSILGTSTGWAQNQKKQVLPDGVKLIQDIEYAKHDGVGLKLDLYVPKEIKGSVPVIVFVHGGGWKNGSKSQVSGGLDCTSRFCHRQY